MNNLREALVGIIYNKLKSYPANKKASIKLASVFCNLLILLVGTE